MRYGFDGLAAQVAPILGADPFSGHVFIFRGKRADYLKILYYDGSGLCLFAKRLERGKFVWPPIVDGGMVLTPAQMALLIEAIDCGGRWRPRRHAGRWPSSWNGIGPLKTLYPIDGVQQNAAMSLASDPLPTDPDALRAFAATLQAELARRDIEIAAHAAEIHAKTLHIEK
jgi:transposase